MNLTEEKIIEQGNENGYHGIEELLHTEILLTKYNRWIAKRIASHLNNKIQIVDFGAGTGSISELVAAFIGEKPICVESDVMLSATLQSKGFSCYKNLESIDALQDAVYSSNVIEHIQDDQKILKDMYATIKPGGLCVLYVPASPFLYSAMDEKVGHYRRYTKRDLCEKVENAGFCIIKCHYAESIGFFASLVVKFFGYKEKSLVGGLKLYDNLIHPLNLFFDSLGVKYLFGKNLFLVAKK